MSDDPVVILANISGTFVGTPTNPISSFAESDNTTSFVPDVTNFSAGTNSPLKKDVDGNLIARSLVFTDESSFRDDFVTPSISTILTGTVTFTSASSYISGSGTLFLSELTKEKYVKSTSHSEETYVLVSDVLNDNEATLSEPYVGATVTSTANASLWNQVIGSGCAITISGSKCKLNAGTVDTSMVLIKHVGDYLPISVGCVASVTQRVAGNQVFFGVGDSYYTNAENQAFVILDGTDESKVKFVTSIASNDIEETVATLPNGIVTSGNLQYQIEVGTDRVSLLVNDIKLIQHRLHLPGPYAALDCYAGNINAGVPSSDTFAIVDVFYMSNFDQVQIGAYFKGDPIRLDEARSTLPSGSLVLASNSDVELLATNTNRMGATITNDSTSILFLKLGTSASPTSYTVKMTPDSYYEVPFNYSGPVHGCWTVATGSAMITELT